MAVTPRCRGPVPEAAACEQGSGEDGAGGPADPAGNHATCVMASHADQREARSQNAARPMADGCHDQPAGDRGARRAPGHKQKEKTMIFHINRASYKAGLIEEQRQAGVEART